MKNRGIRLSLFILATVLAILALWLWPRFYQQKRSISAKETPDSPKSPNTQSKSTNTASSVAAHGKVPSDALRLAVLERLGQVPENADTRDWWLAQKTSWWGKRLEPQIFWKDRVLWLDSTATHAARRHGRFFPPPPYEDPVFANRSDVDESTQAGVDSPDVSFKLSDKENAFWDKFSKTHPMPPDSIVDRQQLSANQTLSMRHAFEHEGNPMRTTEARLSAMAAAQRKDLEKLGYPPEAFSDEALYWAYILEKRSEYEQDYARGPYTNSDHSRNFLTRLFVDEKLVTQPLDSSQMNMAGAWRWVFLQRLRRQKTEESYINAYLEAWSLSPGDVFGATSGPNHAPKTPNAP
jgi:hypothetical protein